jgi:small subunit ribosomal protein S7
MPRRRIKIERKWNPDPVYNSIMVTRFINNLMRDGEKTKLKKFFIKLWKLLKKKQEKIQ